jgi:Raf kinase inhibitor-like YbhB/YbcL family protein
MNSKETFSLTSNDLGGVATTIQAFNDWGSDGENISPHLKWSNVPQATKSFALTMFDPDAPTGSGWWHWLMFDISHDVNELVSNAGSLESNLAPKNSIQSLNNYGIKGYGGPCPPIGHGWHQYIITIHALKVESLGLNEDTNPAIVGYHLWENTISKASLVTYYQRSEAISS